MATYCTSKNCAKRKVCPDHISKAPGDKLALQGDLKDNCLMYEKEKMK